MGQIGLGCGVMEMSVKKYRVKLTTEERQELKALVFRRRAAAYKQTHARVLLLSDEGQGDGAMKDEEIARALRIGCSTVERVRRRCVEEGVDAALERSVQIRRRRKKLDGQGEAHLIAMACGEPQQGRAGWTLTLLADRLVECEVVDCISTETVRQTLQNNELKPWLKECWCIPPGSSSEFVCAMEDVLEVYHRQYGDNEVLVCLDETSKQQTKETRLPRPARPRSSSVCDYEYERNGVSNLFMLFAPLEGWRRVEVTDQRTKADWARVVKQLVDVDYAHKDRIVLVMDNLNAHHPASLYEALELSEARRIAERLEVHYTPKHGSWLNMAEIEIGVMARECLDRRISDQSTLRREIEAWQDRRNRDTIRVNWRFTTADARIKLKSLYPSIHN